MSCMVRGNARRRRRIGRPPRRRLGWRRKEFTHWPRHTEDGRYLWKSLYTGGVLPRVVHVTFLVLLRCLMLWLWLVVRSSIPSAAPNAHHSPLPIEGERMAHQPEVPSMAPDRGSTATLLGDQRHSWLSGVMAEIVTSKRHAPRLARGGLVGLTVSGRQRNATTTKRRMAPSTCAGGGLAVHRYARGRGGPPGRQRHPPYCPG